MATRALIAAGQYLPMRFEREPELVHGELAEKTFPTRAAAECKSAWQSSSTVRATAARRFEGNGPAEEIRTTAPMLVFEISPPQDRFRAMFRRLDEY
jgi:hypothetical protein